MTSPTPGTRALEAAPSASPDQISTQGLVKTYGLRNVSEESSDPFEREIAS